MRIILILILVGNSFPGFSQSLATNNIDAALKKDANVVIRNSVKEFKVINSGKAIETNHFEITILNETGKREATQYVFYSDLVKVLEMEGAIYDMDGKKVKKIKNTDIDDVSATGSSMYSDNRLKVIDFTYPSYPYSIVFTYRVMHTGLMFYPNWDPQDSYRTSVEYAKFKVIVPEALGLNYFEYQVEANQTKDDILLIYEWEVENLPGFDLEPYGPPGRDLTPYVLLTPKQFKMEGYNGSMTSWESIGNWSKMLSEGKDDLPEEAKKEVDEILRGINDKREKTKLIYEYVQNTTRYVSVQLGIGGWQPYDATYVYENGYGDCKALTNYTESLLNYTGVESIYTLVWAGNNESDIVTEFPNARFNHAFLAVPFEKDTVWLECTSQTVPFGYTGSWTSDRHVLMTTEDGGKLVKTPTYTEKENLQVRVAEIEIDMNGDAKASIKTKYSGLQYENVRSQIDESPEDQRKWLSKRINLDKTKILDLGYDLEPGIVPKITEMINVTSSGYGNITGNRIFFEVNPLNQLTSIPKKIKDRKNDVYIEMAYTDIDSLHFVLPEGFYVEYLPQSQIIETPFANYSTTYTLTENGIDYVRKMVRWKGVYPAESYEAFRTMRKNISRSDKTKIVLVGST